MILQPQTTDDPQGPVRPTPVQSQHTNDSAVQTLDSDPTLSADIQKALAQSGATEAQDPPVKKPGIAGLWQRIKDFQSQANQGAETLNNAAMRGVAEGVNNISNTLVGAAVGISKKTGLYKVGRSPEEQQQFLKYWDQHTSDANPIQLPEDHINKWWGASQGGLPGFVEGASQFATGLAAANEVLPFGGEASKVAGAVRTAAKGAVADISAFDPFKKRLSNLIESGPSWLSNPLTRMLEAKPDDTEGEARFKQAAEGILTNGTIEAVLHGVRAIRAGKNGEDALPHIQNAAQAASQPVESEVAKAVQTDANKYTVTPSTLSSQQMHGMYAADDFRTTAREQAQAAGAELPRGQAETLAASFNYIAKNHELPVGDLDEESTKAFQDRMKAYTDGDDERTVEQLRDQYGINVNYTQAPEDVVNTIKSMADVFPEPSTVARNIPQTHAEISAAAQDMFKDMSGDEVLQNAARIFGNTEQLPKQVLAMREWMYAQASQTQKLSQMVEANPDNSVAVEQLGQALDTMMDFHAHLTGTSSNIARALNAHQIPVGEAAEALEGGTAAPIKGAATEADATMQEAEQAGGQVSGAPQHRAPESPKATAGLTPLQIRSLARSIFMTGNEDPAAVLALARGPKVTAPVVQALDKSTLSKFADYAQAYRINAMLSGPKTQLTKVTSDFLTMLQRPAEYWWAGVRGSNPELRQMGSDMYAGFFGNMRDSWNAARKAMMTGENILVPGNSHTGTAAFGAVTDPTFNNLIQTPSRFLMSTDEFAKQMNYRMNMRAQILRQARQSGVSDAAELSRRVTEDMQWAFDPDGGAVNPIAREYAKQNTFTNDLRPGSIQKWIQEGTASHPILKVVMPFVRTPMNLFNFAWERTPLLNRINKDFADELAGRSGPEAQMLAKAKNDFGTAAWGTAAALTMSGHITGRGPEDPALRKQWVAAGNQPYSIRVPGTDEWISYRRANPIATPLGLVADMVQMSSDSRQTDWTDKASAVAASFIANVSSKTFMQGWTQFADAMSSGRPDAVKTALTSFAGTFVPSAANEMNPDNTFRETRGLVDELASRVPGWSKTLEPRRNILGEPILRPPGYFNDAINPFTAAPGVKPNDVQNELVKIGKAFSMPSEKINGGMIDLTNRDAFNDGPKQGQSPYDRMLELMAHPADGAPGIREQLTNIVNSDEYKSVPGDDAYGPGGLKWKIVNAILQGSQQTAFAQVLEEYPSLMQAYTGSFQAKGAGAAGGKSAAEAVLAPIQNLFRKK